MKKIKLFLNRPINICIIFLSILYILASFERITSSTISVLPYLLFSFGSSFFFIYFIPWLLNNFKFKLINSSGSIVSALIFLLVIDPKQNIFIILLTLVVYLVGRLFLRYQYSPIFNPIVFSIVVTYIILNFFNVRFFVSWWGASFSPRFTDLHLSIAIFLTVPFGIYLCWRLKKLYTVVFGFIFTTLFFSINQLYISGVNWADFLDAYSSIFLEGTMSFALYIMLAEPKTSPSKKYSQIVFALIFSIVWSAFLGLKFSNIIIFGIFTANIFTFGEKVYLKRKMKKTLPNFSNKKIINSNVETVPVTITNQL